MLNPPYPRLATGLVPNMITRFGQPCAVVQPRKKRAFDGDGVSELETRQSVCVVTRGVPNKPIVDGFSGVYDPRYCVVLLPPKIQPLIGAIVQANNRDFLVTGVETVNTANMALLYKATAMPLLSDDELLYEVAVVVRSIVGDHPDDDKQSNTNGRIATECLMACATVKEYKQVEGVNIDDSVTHVFSARFDDVCELDVQAHALISGGKVFRIVAIKNIGELSRVLEIHCVKKEDWGGCD